MTLLARAENPRLRVISLGAGVQSTTMALMAAAGEIGPMPDCAIFADTQWEPKAVYEHLDRLEEALPFPVYRVTAGSVREGIVASTNTTGQRFAAVPFFTSGGGMGRRQCTKVMPLQNKQRELLGYKPRQRIPAGSSEVWIGISTDEASRMKPAQNKWQVNRFPLIEQRMNRHDCISWLAAHGWCDVPKSSCIGCPFHSDHHWRDMKDGAPDEWQDAVDVDALIRSGGTLRGMNEKQYMHPKRIPLSEVDLSTLEDHGQLNLFENECEGMCGT